MPKEPDFDDRVLVGTPVMDKLEQSNLPFRGERRKEILSQFKTEIKARRTSTGVAKRISNVTIGTAGQVAVNNVQENFEQTLRDVIENVGRE